MGISRNGATATAYGLTDLGECRLAALKYALELWNERAAERSEKIPGPPDNRRDQWRSLKDYGVRALVLFVVKRGEEILTTTGYKSYDKHRAAALRWYHFSSLGARTAAYRKRRREAQARWRKQPGVIENVRASSRKTYARHRKRYLAAMSVRNKKPAARKRRAAAVKRFLARNPGYRKRFYKRNRPDRALALAA